MPREGKFTSSSPLFGTRGLPPYAHPGGARARARRVEEKALGDIGEASIVNRDLDGVEDNLILPANDTSPESAGEAPSSGEDMDMGGSKKPTIPALTDAHHGAFEVSWRLLQFLSDNLDDESAINGAQECNRKILEISTANGFPNSSRFVVDFEVYQGGLRKAHPLLAQRKQNSSEKPREELEVIKQWLENFIKERGYPKD
ncbi:hypothetical protein LTR72_008631 [Exophiala xenobiotica]|nr:hypothetical protein LTR72_008631 [Exophiala xenobiotica]KAK5290330.1 hypothetical protein LTR14_006633 [Exophiala xenobiotica]KAK5480123.1 hypothetical protein LTR55_007486 [Exophiala xenobiotica]